MTAQSKSKPDERPLYPPWANVVYRLAIFGGLICACLLIMAPMLFVRSPYNTGQLEPKEQPVAFDHRHHVRDDGIECLYCHYDAEKAPRAGIPATELCMGCHSQVWRDSPKLEMVRASAANGIAIPWRRVNDLPGYVYFHHGVHVSHPIACERCHGDVRQMASVVQTAPLTMAWCLDCHRNPRNLQDTLDIGSSWEATADLMAASFSNPRAVTSLTTCTTCHR